MGNAVTVHLIRHEKTQANVERRYIGRTDEPILSAKARCMTHDATTVYTSALQRTQLTARLYFPQAAVKAFAGFNELDFGDFEMKTYADLEQNEQYRVWIDAPMQVTPPNGESFQQFQMRVLQTFQQVVNEGGTYTFVVHGGVIRTILAQFLPTRQSFQQVSAEHFTQYTLMWDDLKTLKEGRPCTSFSEVYLTEKPPM